MPARINSSRLLQRGSILLSLAAFGLGLCLGQTGGVTLEITGSASRKINLAVPPFQADSGGEAQKVGQIVSKTVRDDLDFSGLFTLVDPKYYDYVTGYSEKRVLHKDWLGLSFGSIRLSRHARLVIGLCYNLYSTTRRVSFHITGVIIFAPNYTNLT